MIKKIVKPLIPPIFLKLFSICSNQARLKQLPEWEYLGTDWSDVAPEKPADSWNDSAVSRVMEEHWSDFCQNLEAPSAFGLSNESIWKVCEDRNFHNDVLSYAYVLSIAYQSKKNIKILDWGGSTGHYYKIAQALYPEYQYDYTVKEVPSICNTGR